MACHLMHSLISESVFEIRWRSELLICTYIAGKSDNLQMIKVLGEGNKFSDSLFCLGKAQLRDFFFFLYKPFNSRTAVPSLHTALWLEDHAQVIDRAPRTPAKKHGFWWSLEGFMVNSVNQSKSGSGSIGITNVVNPRGCYLLLMVCLVADGLGLV